MTFKLILLAIAASGVAFFVWDYTSTKAENKRLEGEILAANDTIARQDLKLEKELGISATKEERIRKIRNAPKSDDGLVAPVLRDAISGLQDNGE